MSEPSNYCIFSAESIEELAERIYAMLPEDVFVTVMFMEYDEETDIFTIGPPTNGMPSMEVARNEKRMDKVIDLVGPHPPWSYDTEKYPSCCFPSRAKNLLLDLSALRLAERLKTSTITKSSISCAILFVCTCRIVISVMMTNMSMPHISMARSATPRFVTKTMNLQTTEDRPPRFVGAFFMPRKTGIVLTPAA